jgi:hypothetical protein
MPWAFAPVTGAAAYLAAVVTQAYAPPWPAVAALLLGADQPLMGVSGRPLGALRS